jgi:V8-like Glu-specific endopeptidase
MIVRGHAAAVTAVAATAAVTGLAVFALAACSPGGPRPAASGKSGSAPARAAGLASTSASPFAAASALSGYWTTGRLRDARARRAREYHTPSPGTTPSPRSSAPVVRVGALFDSDSSGGHFCTASVVRSPGHNLIVTAAHCINSGNGGADNENIAFVPAYQDGKTPFGIWSPQREFMDSHWLNGADQDYDVAFVQLKPLDGKNIQDVLGANQIAFNTGYQQFVRVAGYPSSADAPIACQNWTSKQSATQLKFSCQDFTGGTSGSPWITRFDPITRTGAIVGVIGGYQQGGDTASVSYSVRFGPAVLGLYRQAVADEGASG